ncbi:MAG: type II toxin-antitoxin system YhaV family toxin [Bdellovibrionaceae bacterium]|nr:type II toxin-antitoxin system YhaV family toxin [Pseudobdellovibrionaceae bacterium]
MASTRRKPAASGVVGVEVNGWKLFTHPVFLDQFEALVVEVEEERSKDPAGYRDKKKTKLLAAILKIAFEVIPRDPADRMFQQGKTLGKEYRHWRRAKFFEGRFRLFFRYSSAARIIVLAWVNDEETLRTYGSKTDAYAVFQGMLKKNRPPDDWDALLREAAGGVMRSETLMGKAGKIR